MTNRKWGRAPHYNPIASPVYLSLVARATLCRHTKQPIIQRYNSVYHYWATYRDMRFDEVTKYFGPDSYQANIKPGSLRAGLNRSGEPI